MAANNHPKARVGLGLPRFTRKPVPFYAVRCKSMRDLNKVRELFHRVCGYKKKDIFIQRYSYNTFTHMIIYVDHKGVTNRFPLTAGDWIYFNPFNGSIATQDNASFLKEYAEYCD